MKYRHDHLADSSADNSPRSSPQQRGKANSSSSKSASRPKVPKPVHPATPSRSSRHRKTSSKGSTLSVSSAHKRGVAFSHVRKKSVHSSSSTQSIKSHTSTARVRLEPEPEPPLPQSSSLLIAAIDQLTMSLSSRPTTNAYQAPAITQTSSQQNPARLASSPTSPLPALSPSLSSSPPPSDTSSPALPLQRVEYSVRSAKEGPAKRHNIGLLGDDEENRVRKISAEFATSICERVFNSARYASDSSKDSGSRSTSATSASTAPSSVGERSPLVDERKFAPPLQLSFEPIMSTGDVINSEAQDEWVRNFEQYLQDSGRVTQETYRQNSAVLPAISEKSAPAPVDDGRFIDAEEDDIDFATEIANLLNTPPVLKKRMTASTTLTASSTPTSTAHRDSRAASSTVSLEYSRLQISSILNNQAFYDFIDNEAETGVRRVSAASTATSRTTVRHTSLSSTILEEPCADLPVANGSQGKPGPIPVTTAFERQKPFSKTETLKPKMRSLREKFSANEHTKPSQQVESHTSTSKEQPPTRPINGTGIPAVTTTGRSYGKYTPLILDFEEDVPKAEEEHTKSESAQPHPIVNHSSPRKRVSFPQTEVFETSLKASRESPVKADPKWVKIQKHLIPRRAAPPPPTVDQSKNNKKPKFKKKKNTRESGTYCSFEFMPNVSLINA
ncbi:hypothetical protein V1525DRAFT_9645 [Lipomyces kononenkoae]|uniref:Uncharacterized protein n=1 Tax=Lipomyces kononenkoae TaxID=34357 RepID=A0ACC3TBT4_LIPKO